MRLRHPLRLLLVCVLTACGGGGDSGTVPSPIGTVTPSFTVSTNVDSGISLTPAVAIVEQGKQATFSVTLKQGASVNTLSGCNGTLANSTYTTAPITTACSVTATSRSAFTLNNIRLKPNALFKDEFASSPVVVEVVTTGAAGLRLSVNYLSSWFDASVGTGFITVPLYDDGTHGDRFAGDGIYTTTFATGIAARLRYHDKTVDRLPLTVTASDTAGNNILSANSIVAQVNLGVVDRLLAVTPVRVGDGLFAASNMVNIVMADLSNPSPAFALKLYQYFPDVFDGIAVNLLGVTAGSNTPNGGAYRNAVQGINQPLYDNSRTYGSNGVLASAVSLASDIIGESFLHEFGHTTMFYLNNPALELTAGTIFHTAASTFLGLMGDRGLLQEQGNGDFLVAPAPDGGNYQSRQYADLELYLMGMLPPQSIAPMNFVTDPTVNVNTGRVVPKAKAQRVTIEDIIRVYGQRLPTSGQSQKSFRFAFVALSETPATAAEIAVINRVAAFYESNSPGAEVDRGGLFPVYSTRPFRAATKGIGELITRLPNLK